MTDRKENVEEQVTYGLDKLDSEAKVEVNLKDLVYLHQAFGELNRFFHQRLHYTKLEHVESFIGTANDPGALSVIHKCYYEITVNMLPDSLIEMFEQGEFDNPKFPEYYQNGC